MFLGKRDIFPVQVYQNEGKEVFAVDECVSVDCVVFGEVLLYYDGV